MLLVRYGTKFEQEWSTAQSRIGGSHPLTHATNDAFACASKGYAEGKQEGKGGEDNVH